MRAQCNIYFNFTNSKKKLFCFARVLPLKSQAENIKFVKKNHSFFFTFHARPTNMKLSRCHFKWWRDFCAAMKKRGNLFYRIKPVIWWMLSVRWENIGIMTSIVFNGFCRLNDKLLSLACSLCKNLFILFASFFFVQIHPKVYPKFDVLSSWINF